MSRRISGPSYPRARLPAKEQGADRSRLPLQNRSSRSVQLSHEDTDQAISGRSLAALPPVRGGLLGLDHLLRHLQLATALLDGLRQVLEGESFEAEHVALGVHVQVDVSAFREVLGVQRAARLLRE